jgi:hypothetical protein
VLDLKGKSVAKLAFKEFFEGLVNSNMKPTLVQICKDETYDAMKYDTRRVLHVKFYEPGESKHSGFSHLESLKNTKRRLQIVHFS